MTFRCKTTSISILRWAEEEGHLHQISYTMNFGSEANTYSKWLMVPLKEKVKSSYKLWNWSYMALCSFEQTSGPC